MAEEELGRGRNQRRDAANVDGIHRVRLSRATKMDEEAVVELN